MSRGLVAMNLFIPTVKLVRLRNHTETRNERDQSMQSYRELEAGAVIVLIFIQPYSRSLFHVITRIRTPLTSIV